MKRLFIPILAVAACMSCRQEEPVQAPEPPLEAKVVAGAGTKVTLDDGTVKWEDGDRIALVFSGPESCHVQEFETAIPEGVSGTATFVGTLDRGVQVENGYSPRAFAVYPYTAVSSDGSLAYVLPSVQTASASGTFASGLSLASASFLLEDIMEDGQVDVQFRNALSVLRLTPSSDVQEITITGTAPLAGKAPLKVNHSDDDTDGRLVLDETGSWEEESLSVTLRPADGTECFTGDVAHNVLMWPGSHSALKITMTLKNLGVYERSVNRTLTFEPSKYYNLNFNSQEEVMVTEITGRLDEVEGQLPAIDESLEAVKADISELLTRIQSVTLMSEYLDNAVCAPYASFASLEKQDIVLDYIVRPASVAQAIVEKINSSGMEVSEVMTVLAYYRETSGFSDITGDFLVLPVKSVGMHGDVMTVSVEASAIADDFYQGEYGLDLILQMTSGQTDVVSDIAKLVPVEGSGIRGNYIDDIPVPAGVEVSIPFSYSVSSSDYSFSATGNNVSGVNLTYNDNYKTGYLTVGISSTVPVSEQSVDVVLTVGGNVATKTFTFVDAGRLEITTDGPADHIGGDVVVTVEHNDFGAGTLSLHSAGGTGVSQNNSVFTFPANTSSSIRAATALYSIKNGSLTYNRYIPVEQYGTSTALQRKYYPNGDNVLLNTATAGYHPLNIVILGDGFMKKDLSVGGKFERTARSAVETFFSIEPYKTFRNRFNVYMMAYESAEEGTDVVSSGVYRNTYFSSSFNGGAVTSDKNLIVNVVRNTLGLSSDAQFYRTVVLVLVNTDENAGSCDYASQTTIDTDVTGDGYASFSIATLSAYSTGTNGLIKHEGGGHAFGRLGDEYSQSWYTADIINQRHGVGFYRNIATDMSYWSAFTDAGYSSSEVGYHNYMSGLYVSTNQTGMMWNNSGTFNAVSRWAIYDRICKQSEGYGDYWQAFLSYDSRNR